MFPMVNPQQNPIINMFGSVQNFTNQFNAFKQSFNPQGMNPQAIVQNMLNSGRMSQSQFNQLSSMADQIMRMNQR